MALLKEQSERLQREFLENEKARAKAREEERRRERVLCRKTLFPEVFADKSERVREMKKWFPKALADGSESERQLIAEEGGRARLMKEFFPKALADGGMAMNGLGLTRDESERLSLWEESERKRWWDEFHKAPSRRALTFHSERSWIPHKIEMARLREKKEKLRIAHERAMRRCTDKDERLRFKKKFKLEKRGITHEIKMASRRYDVESSLRSYENRRKIKMLGEMKKWFPEVFADEGEVVRRMKVLLGEAFVDESEMGRQLMAHEMEIARRMKKLIREAFVYESRSSADRRFLSHSGRARLHDSVMRAEREAVVFRRLLAVIGIGIIIITAFWKFVSLHF